jgi:hypothetical protein
MARIHTSKTVAVTLLIFVLAIGLVPRAVAQNDELVVTATQVYSQDFPQVTAYVTVSDENGLPLVGLTEANFSILEDGNPVPTASIAVESDTSQDLGLVLALDLSTPKESLDQIQEAVGSFHRHPAGTAGQDSYCRLL